MKKHFPSVRPNEVFEQIEKYDGELVGWWTDNEKIEKHDLVLLTHLTSSVRAKDAYNAWVGEGHSYRRAFAIVEFSYNSQGQLWYLLRRVEGRLSDPVHDEDLRVGKQISERHLIALFSKWKFSEQEPPVMYMLLLIHDYVLPLFPSEDEFEKETGGKYPIVDVSPAELKAELAKQFCPLKTDDRYFELPRLAWVTAAIEVLTRVGLAQAVPRKGESDDAGVDPADRRYRISLRKSRKKDTIAYFTDKLLQLEWDKAAARPSSQPSLFAEG